MTTNPTIRLLILNDSRTEAERLISMLNNAGRQTRAQHAESEEVLVKLMQEQTWDVLICHDTNKTLSAASAIRQVRRLNKDLPVVLLTDEEGSKPIVEGIKLGAVDVVRLDEDQHLLQVIAREHSNREQRNLMRVAERRYKEMERRNQQLLDSSRDGFAFIQDGMFVYTNESFAEILGYRDRDDLECMPLIDMVSEEDQDRVKNFLKQFMLRGSDIETTKLTFTAITEQDKQKTLNVDVRKAQYLDEEICIQFVVKANSANTEELEEQLEQIRQQDLATGLFNKNYLVEQLELVVDKAVKQDARAALLYLAINNFVDTVQSKMGIAATDIVLGSIAAHARTLVKEGELLCRFSEDGFMLLIPEIDADEAQHRAEKLAKAMSSYIIDIEGSTLQLTYCVGVSLINETTSHSDVPISHAMKALELARVHHAKDKQIVARTFEEQKIEGEGQSAREVAKMVQKALDKNRFRLLYQPILSLRGSDMEHYEILLRMVDDDDNGVSPNEFLEIAAEIGAITKIDRWVILESIKVLSEHRSKGHKTRLIVNLSKESMKDPTLPPWLGVAFKAAKLPGSSIIFQLQESDVNDHLNLAKAFTQQVTALGAECSISRFGCVLNPFNALEHVTAQYIKVDGSFTQELQSGHGEPEALGELVSKLHEREKITIVPFVENASVLSKLWQSGVHYIQGYYLQGPAASMDYDFDTES